MDKKDKINPFQTILVISTGLGIFSYLYQNDIVLIIALCISVLALLSEKLAKLINAAWFGIADILGRIIPRIVLSLVFYLILTPIALISRVFNKSDELKLKSGLHSTFDEVRRKYSSNSFENPW